MNKYRFKTQDEFIRDGQWYSSYDCPVGWSQNGDMNHYLGQDVPEGANENCVLHEGFEDDGWWFESTNYVLKESFDITFYVQYCPEFTEDLYNALMEWCKTNCKTKPRGFRDNYLGLIENKFFNCSLHYYGVDNNSQIASTKQEYTIDQVKSLIGYTVSEVNPIVSEDYTGRWIKALADNIQCTGVKAGEVIKIIRKSNTYRLDKTAGGCRGMDIDYPLNTYQWELLETDVIDIPKDSEKIEVKDGPKLYSFPSSGAILIEECDDLKEFKRYLFDSGRTCNEAVGNPKYLSWNGTSFWYPTTSTGKTMYKWNQLKHFIPTEKVNYDSILEEAKRRYPIGTKCKCLVLGKKVIILDHTSGGLSGKGCIYFQVSGNHTKVYDNGEWAEILEESPTTLTWEPTTGDAMVGLTKGIINYITGDTTLKESSPYFIEKTKKPSIEFVQSVDVNLRTKKQINKFKF